MFTRYCQKIIKIFSKKLNVRKKLTNTKPLHVMNTVLDICHVFSFPYLTDEDMRICYSITFPIMNYDYSNDLISKGKIKRNEYKDFIDKHSIQKVKIEVHSVTDAGISIDELRAEEYGFHREMRRKLSAHCDTPI